jgi:hypothetical protein
VPLTPRDPRCTLPVVTVTQRNINGIREFL